MNETESSLALWWLTFQLWGPVRVRKETTHKNTCAPGHNGVTCVLQPRELASEVGAGTSGWPHWWGGACHEPGGSRKHHMWHFWVIEAWEKALHMIFAKMHYTFFLWQSTCYARHMHFMDPRKSPVMGAFLYFIGKHSEAQRGADFLKVGGEAWSWDRAPARAGHPVAMTTRLPPSRQGRNGVMAHTLLSIS